MKQMGRLVLREAYEHWNAYYAQPDTMDGALFLGSIRLSIVNRSEHRLAFMELMKSAVVDILSEATGKEIIYGVVQPVSERAGNALTRERSVVYPSGPRNQG